MHNVAQTEHEGYDKRMVSNGWNKICKPWGNTRFRRTVESVHGLTLQSTP